MPDFEHSQSSINLFFISVAKIKTFEMKTTQKTSIF